MLALHNLKSYKDTMANATEMCVGCLGSGAYARLSCHHAQPCDCDGPEVECEDCDGKGEVESDE